MTSFPGRVRTRQHRPGAEEVYFIARARRRVTLRAVVVIEIQRTQLTRTITIRDDAGSITPISQGDKAGSVLDGTR